MVRILGMDGRASVTLKQKSSRDVEACWKCGQSHKEPEHECPNEKEESRRER